MGKAEAPALGEVIWVRGGEGYMLQYHLVGDGSCSSKTNCANEEAAISGTGLLTLEMGL